MALSSMIAMKHEPLPSYITIYLPAEYFLQPWQCVFLPVRGDAQEAARYVAYIRRIL